MLLRCLRQTESSDLRQQIRWALFGFSGYALLRGISIASDYFKWSTGSFGHQLLVEMVAGHLPRARRCCSCSSACSSRCCATGFTTPRSSSAGRRISPLITLAVAAIFAGTADGLKQLIYNYYGNTNSEGPIIFAAALSTMMVNPIQERIQQLVRKEIPEEPVPAPRRFARGRARHARNRFARRDARRNAGADRARRARGAQRR